MDHDETMNRTPIPKSMSPIEGDKVETTMDFYDAVKAIMGGARVRRLEWEDKEIYCTLHDGRLKVLNEKHELSDWIISDGDIGNDDWVKVG